jgi:hypothetical protein
MIPWISLVFVVISPYFVSDFSTNLGLFPPHFSQICKGLIDLVYFFFKEPAFYFIDSLYGLFCLYFINFGPYFLLFLSFCLFWSLHVLVFLGI